MTTRAQIQKDPQGRHCVTIKLLSVDLNDAELAITTNAGYGVGVQQPYVQGLAEGDSVTIIIEEE